MTIESKKPSEEHAEVTHGNGSVFRYVVGCALCERLAEEFRSTGRVPFAPSHKASTYCRSGSDPHCTCDTCF